MDQPTPLRNEDFRKLLTSVRSDTHPAASGGGASVRKDPTFATPSANFRHKQPKNKYLANKKHAGGVVKPKKEKREEDEDNAHLKEILKNYRDRAAERRSQGTQQEETSKLTAAYRAVPSELNNEELRKRKIEESKYLGGDIDHTHLVKGLDFSLLSKVRSEIFKSKQDDDDELEQAMQEGESKQNEDINLAAELAQSSSENKGVRAMHRILFKNSHPQRNEMFMKGKMAYVFDLEDEEADIPTTLIRSLHDCPKQESLATINANALIISKLTQVLAYLRTDNRKRRKGEFEAFQEAKQQEEAAAAAAKGVKPKGDSIYDDIEEYQPKRKVHRERSPDDRRRDRDRRDRHDDRDRDRHDDRRRGDDRRDRDRDRDRERRREEEKRRDEERRKREQEKEEAEAAEKEKKALEREKRRKEMENSGYDECYPGGMEEMGGAWDSDEEDFSKMDLGYKKIVKRWDFDNEEDYAKYQDSREALPKAAYQYGLKTGDGRKTRKTEKSNEKKLDRELNEINKLMEKRKSDKGGDYKKPKY